jgi:hypothetical protein
MLSSDVTAVGPSLEFITWKIVASLGNFCYHLFLQVIRGGSAWRNNVALRK